MKKKFITNLLLLIFLNILIKPLWIFGIDLTVQNVVGATDYGLYFSLFNFSVLLNILLDVGITSYNNRSIAQNNSLLQKHFSNLVALKLVLAVLYAVVCLAAGWIINYNSQQFYLLLFLILNQFLISLTLYLRSNISGLHLFKTDSLLSVMDRTLMIIICTVLLFTNITNQTFNITWFIYAQTAAYIITAITTFLVVLAKSGKFQLNFNPQYFIAYLRKSYPFALLILLMAFYNRADTVMIERLLPVDGKLQAGIYAQAFRLLDAGSMFGALFAGLLLPIFSKMLKQKEAIGDMVKLSFTFIMIPAIIIAITAGVYSTDIMNILYRNHVESSAPIFTVLMFSFTAISTSYIFGTLLTANGSLKQLNIMALGGTIANISLNLILIPKFQAMGAAWASLVTQLITAVIQVIICFKIFNFQTNSRLIIRSLIFLLCTGITAVIASRHFSWTWGIPIIFTTGAITALATKLINLKAIIQMIRDNQ
ncbi:hypothetical protein EYV94_19535 [Puteibacter caeruleilacunae]|nr:hypothetical protein EYV94_19535 [Puteibacter caeruleilacunae]